MKKKSSKIMLLLLTALLLFMVPMTANAASTKTKAMKAYSKMLAKSKLTVTGRLAGKNVTYKYKTSKLAFATAYLDKDNVPELIVKLKNRPSIYIFAYKNGKVKQVSNCVFAKTTGKEKWGYYKKKSTLLCVDTSISEKNYGYYKYANGSLWSTGIAYKRLEENVWVYYKFHSDELRECSKSTYNALIKENIGSTKVTMLSFVNNTKKNRNKNLK